MKKLLTLSVMLFMAGLAIAGDFPRTLFVENNLARSLSAMNLENGIIHNNVLQLGVVPNQLLSYRETLYALNSTPASLMIIDPVTLGVKDEIVFPDDLPNPYFMALNGARKMYVTSLVANKVAVVDLAKKAVVKAIDVGQAPQGILVDNDRAIVTNTGGYPDYAESSVTIIDTKKDSALATLPVPANPQTVVWGPDYNYYILCSGRWGENQGALAVLSLYAPPDYSPAIIDTISIGGFPGDLAILPDGSAYISDWGDAANGFLYKANIYTKNVIRGGQDPIRVGKGAMRLFLDKRRNELYVSAFDMDVVQKIDTENDLVTATYPFGDGAHDMAIVEEIQASDPWADEVVEFHPGSNWSEFGYDFFPYNVLGPPDPNSAISAYFGSTSKEEILSLGHGGDITLKFTDNVVVNGAGVDFIIFENVFINLFTNTPWVEAGTVSVSQDGATFYPFPYDTTTLEGLAGAHPVNNTQNPTEPQLSGGDAFDLDAVGLDWIRYVRISDMGDRWIEGPFQGDFDLDAVVAVNSSPGEPTGVAAALPAPRRLMLLQNYPNPFNPNTTIAFHLDRPGWTTLTIYAIDGRLVKSLLRQELPRGDHHLEWDGRNERGEVVSSGVYLARLKSPGDMHYVKMNFIR